MNVVIDANVIKAYFEEEILRYPAPRPGRTSSPSQIFANLGTSIFAFLDANQQLEYEWRTNCAGGEEWFDHWLSCAYAAGDLTPVDVTASQVDRKKYRSVGFPDKGRDIWYVRVAVAVSAACTRSNSHLITEDVDFFDPSKKKDASRDTCIRSGKGPVAKLLREDGVSVTCIQNFIEEL